MMSSNEDNRLARGAASSVAPHTLCLLAALLQQASAVSAGFSTFSPSSSAPAFVLSHSSSPPATRRSGRRSSPLSHLTATVYYPDASSGVLEDDAGGYGYGDYDYGDSTATTTTSSSAVSSSLQSLAENLNHLNMAELAKLASAFSPPGHDISLHNINSVTCLMVDELHIEIEAVICEEVSCASLFVPVYFPEECRIDEGGIEACVMGNLHSLHDQGERLLQSKEQNMARDVHDALASLHSSYDSASPYEVASWWTPPSTPSDIQECHTLKEALNDGPDFGSTLRILAMRCLPGRDHVQHAEVREVGPRGMILRATLSTKNRVDAVEDARLVDVPVPFGAGTSLGSTSIREAVLSLVSTVECEQPVGP